MPDRQYTVLVTEKVRKALLKLPSSIAAKFDKKLLELEKNPRPPGSKKIKRKAGL
jgi:mRNA-degrading endonuclease RelE of RelBE toxin-antitoxin system